MYYLFRRLFYPARRSRKRTVRNPLLAAILVTLLAARVAPLSPGLSIPARVGAASLIGAHAAYASSDDGSDRIDADSSANTDHPQDRHDDTGSHDGKDADSRDSGTNHDDNIGERDCGGDNADCQNGVVSDPHHDRDDNSDSDCDDDDSGSADCAGDNTPPPPPPPQITGSITVCKVIENASGTAIGGSDFSGAVFAIPGFTPGASTTTSAAAGLLPTSTFTTPLSPNTKLFGSSENNAQCATYVNLILGHYYYGQESIASSTYIWGAPEYNDQLSVAANSLSDFFPYSPELYDTDPSNDGARNQNADGDILLTSARPTRQLIVLNRFLGQQSNSTSTASSTPSADISIAKSVDNPSPHEGDTVRYTLTVAALGPSTSTGAVATDTLPTGLTFVSATSSKGSFASSTGTWTIGDMPASSTASLTIAALVNAGTSGTTIINSASVGESSTVADHNPGNNSSTVAVNVGSNSTPSPPPPDPGCSGCGVGGGGGGGGTGYYLPSPPSQPAPSSPSSPTTQGQVLGASCGIYLREYIRLGARNNPGEVKKLQIFLNKNLGANLPVTGYYGKLTYEAVKQFQVKYHADVLEPWVPYGLSDGTTPTGYVYKTTQRWINFLMCPALNLPLPPLP